MERTSIPYRTLDPEVEAAIRADRKAGRRHPRAFDDADVVRREPKPHDEATLARPAFARDIEKILNVPAYNRYADKTQVFSFVENDDISRRGLHVQLVSRVARGIGTLLGLNCELIEAIALGHDVGHTPASGISAPATTRARDATSTTTCIRCACSTSCTAAT